MFKSMVDAEDNVRIQQELLDATALRYKIAAADYRNGLMSFQDFNTHHRRLCRPTTDPALRPTQRRHRRGELGRGARARSHSMKRKCT